ncbi:hypothetical protein EL22_20125 [Halostagnicola sp. A56]|nr:hypothetical protein EL22_20125 [Halostagnicola sp. A56]
MLTSQFLIKTQTNTMMKSMPGVLRHGLKINFPTVLKTVALHSLMANTNSHKNSLMRSTKSSLNSTLTLRRAQKEPMQLQKGIIHRRNSSTNLGKNNSSMLLISRSITKRARNTTMLLRRAMTNEHAISLES